MFYCSAGQLTVEGGNCTYPPGLPCSSIMGPQPITCLAMPSVFQRGLDPGCGYQACCEPQMCCLHGIPSQSDLPSLDKSQLEATLYNSSCVQPALISASLHQNQQIQKCWDTESSSKCPPPTESVPVVGTIQLNYSRGSTSQPKAADSKPHSQPKSYLSYYQHQTKVPPDNQAQQSAKPKCQRKPSTRVTQQELSLTAVDRDVTINESWEKRCRVQETCRQIAGAESRGLQDEELKKDNREQSPEQQQLHVPPAAEPRKEQQRTRPALMLRDHRDGKVSNLRKIGPNIIYSFLNAVFKNVGSWKLNVALCYVNVWPDLQRWVHTFCNSD